MFNLTNDLKVGNKASAGFSISALKLILLLLVLTGTIQTSAQNFFPLQVGNSYMREDKKHTYSYSWNGSSYSYLNYYYDSTNVADTIRFENKLFYKYRGYYYYLDNSENKLYIKIGNETKLAVDFSAPQGLSEMLYFNNEARQYNNSGVYMTTVFGELRQCYKISRTIVVSDPVWSWPEETWVYEYIFADGIGLYKTVRNYENWTPDHRYGTDHTFINMFNYINGNYFVELKAPKDTRAYLINNYDVKLSWNHYQFIIDSFVIERKRNDEINFSIIANIPSDSLEYIDSTTVPGYKYYYRIKANKMGFLSLPDKPVSVVSIDPPEILYADTTLIDAVNIHWSYDDDLNIHGFVIYRRDSEINVNPNQTTWTQYKILDTVSVDTRSYIDSNLYASDFYMYKMYAFKDSLQSLSSGQLIVSPKHSTPNPPFDITYSLTSDEGILLKWNSVNIFSNSFVIERRTTNPLSDFHVVNDSTVAESSYTDYNIIESTEYEYRIKCINQFNASSYSDTIGVISPEFYPVLTPGDCRGFQTDSGTVVIEWNDNSFNESGYKIEYYHSVSGWNLAGVTGIDKEIFEHPKPSVIGFVGYRIQAFNSHNVSDYAQFHVQVVSSVNDKNENITFNLSNNYPNPFNPSTKIKYSIPRAEDALYTTQKTQLLVYDILGNEIAVLVDELKSPGVYEVDFDGTNLSSGIYIYRLSFGNYSKCNKMTLLK